MKNMDNDTLTRTVDAVQRKEPEAALAILNECIAQEGASEYGLDCRLMRAMGYGNGLFSHPNAKDLAIKDYQFVKAHRGTLPLDHPKIFIDALWSQGPDRHYDELLSEIITFNAGPEHSLDSEFLLATLYESYGKDYQKAQEHYRAAFAKGSWDAGRSWGRCLVRDGKPLRGTLVALSAWLARPFLKVLSPEKGAQKTRKHRSENNFSDS
jgi:hypothetical protein